MNKLEVLIAELKKALFENEQVQTYLALKQEIVQSEELKLLEKEITHHKKMMTKFVGNDDLYFASKKAYEIADKKYNDHPLIVNFNYQREMLKSLLSQIKNILE